MYTGMSDCWWRATGLDSEVPGPTKDETHRLARIRLDIPNDADIDWKIDIRKSMARPPVSLRPWLTQLAQSTRDRAVRTFAKRGK